jgi:protein required for attachment to host cells
MPRSQDVRETANRAANIGVKIREAVAEEKKLRRESEDHYEAYRDSEQQADNAREEAASLRDELVDCVAPRTELATPPPGPPDPPQPPLHRPVA